MDSAHCLRLTCALSLQCGMLKVCSVMGVHRGTELYWGLHTSLGTVHVHAGAALLYATKPSQRSDFEDFSLCSHPSCTGVPNDAANGASIPTAADKRSGFCTADAAPLYAEQDAMWRAQATPKVKAGDAICPSASAFLSDLPVCECCNTKHCLLTCITRLFPHRFHSSSFLFLPALSGYTIYRYHCLYKRIPCLA